MGKLICIDFDGTCIDCNDWPKTINTLPCCIETLQELIANNHQLILWTCRSNSISVIKSNESGMGISIDPGLYLKDAINWFKQNNIPLVAINKNPTQTFSGASPKPFADLYIDDKNPFTPLINGNIDWIKMRTWLKQNKYI